jgi:tetratricopeptide (TPR) repeat protein
MRRGREPLLDAGLVVYYASTALGAGFVEEHAGDPRAAVEVLRDGFERLAELGEHAFASTVAADIARANLRLGRDTDAEQWLARARELCPPGDVATLATADACDAILHVRRRRLDDAERLVTSALEHTEASDFWELRGDANEALAEVHAANGRRDDARAALEAALVVYDAKGATVAAGRTRALLAQL